MAPLGARVRAAMEPVMDLSLHPAQPPSHTLIAVHQLISASVETLNTFAETCESKLLTLHHKVCGPPLRRAGVHLERYMSGT